MTDGAKAMTGTVTGFAVLLEQYPKKRYEVKSLRQINAMKVVRLTNPIRSGNESS